MPTESIFDKYDLEDDPSRVLLSSLEGFQTVPDKWLPQDLTIEQAHYSNWASERALQIVRQARSTSKIGRVADLLVDIKNRIALPYQFDVFKANTYNYGLLSTYRQRWRPINYQVGDLAGSVPLAPSERREVTFRSKTATDRKRTESNLRSSTRNEEEKLFVRAETEITDKASRELSTKAKTGFKAAMSEIVELSGGGEFAAKQGSETAKIKKQVREATRKSTQEYKDENKIEISMATTSELEETETREISNPNNEITVTYLFYELQRRFEVSQNLYDAEPVVMVAFEVPPPHQINEAWLMEHEWTLRDVLLDRKLLSALELLSEDFSGHEFAAQIIEAQWKIQL